MGKVTVGRRCCYEDVSRRIDSKGGSEGVSSNCGAVSRPISEGDGTMDYPNKPSAEDVCTCTIPSTWHAVDTPCE